MTCPECGAVGSLAQFTADVDARAVGDLLAKTSAEIAVPLMRYVGLFRPAQRVLTWPRARKLFAELLDMMESRHITRRGRDWPVTPQMWVEALEKMVDGRTRLTLPLKSHGYLLEILAGLADRSEASAEEKREAELRAGLEHGKRAGARISRQQRIDSEIAGENAARKRLGLKPLAGDEIPAFLAKQGLS